MAELDSTVALGLPSALRRDDEILTHPVFHRYHSEHEMLRYLRRLADKDLALDRTMIPLGSCTMKLNATSEMIPVTWPEFGAIHPHAPADQVQGYLEMIHELEAMLVEITGYDAVSLQPNAGSQGEFAGLLAIRAYHQSRGDTHRNVCLIPSSAHGTNAASAAMAGMRVVVVECDDEGNVDVDDLKRRAVEFSDALSALMVTYPSTHGVFEERIGEICAVVHEYGGQVYLDGANLNALVGTAKPGKFGADVSHLNLHKTFCIPHGGGGPGVGPVAVKVAPRTVPARIRRGARHRRGAVRVGVDPADLVDVRDDDGRPGSHRRDPSRHPQRELHRAAARTALSGAVHRRTRARRARVHSRRAADHAVDRRHRRRHREATWSTTASTRRRWRSPSPGTLMIEPTESEALAELDRFCDAMIAVRAEITAVGAGEWPRDDNPLHNAPHTADDVCADDWTHPYSRELAAYPLASLRQSKYFAPVSRIDGAFGDRNVVCACPPLDAYR